MVVRWTTWKAFPDAFYGEHIEAPIGPGVYEVCLAATGEQVAFCYSANVAQALSKVVPSSNARGWPFFRRARHRYLSSELKYRTCAAGTAGRGQNRGAADDGPAPGDVPAVLRDAAQLIFQFQRCPLARRSTWAASAAEFPRQATIWSGRINARSA